jgi:prepilin-type N-terminal cleavage/methylation domain-containing protein
VRILQRLEQKKERSSEPGDCDGFTLIEVLIALTIFSTSMVVLLGALSQSLSRARESERAMTARVFAQSVLVRLEAGPAPKFGETSGRSEDGLNWTVDIAPYPQHDDSHAVLHAAVMSVTVSWHDGKRSLTLNTMRLGPKP